MIYDHFSVEYILKEFKKELEEFDIDEASLNKCSTFERGLIVAVCMLKQENNKFRDTFNTHCHSFDINYRGGQTTFEPTNEIPY